jgi:tuftelin-interacting protein 11
MLLTPWKSVFGDREWEALLSRAVVPKLEDAMIEFQVNPAAQDLEPFLWVMDWAELMPRNQMSKLLIARFFPKWHAALRHWLSSFSTISTGTTADLNLDDVTRWYLQWKALFPETVLESKNIKSAMNAALDAINTAGQGKPLPTTWTAPPPLSSIPTAAATAAGTSRASYEDAYGHHGTDYSKDQPPPASFLEERPLRALVEDFAVEAEIDFLPKPGRLYEGLQVYGFGLVSCAVDSARQRLYAQMGGEKGKEWVAASMGQLLEEHKKREAAAGSRKNR